MGWQGHLHLHYTRDGERTIALDRHSGPLRVLQRLYPEGPGICHHVLVHPPGGIVGGDELKVEIQQAEGTHAVITTPGATRFYRSAGELATQTVHAQLAPGARLEWLPLETIAYRGCLAENRLRFELAPGAEMMGWEMLALGLPAANQAFDAGRITQQMALPGVWLERARLDASDTLLLDSPLGMAGRRVLGTLWLASGSPIASSQRNALLDAAREVFAGHPLASFAGATSPDAQVLVCRALASRVEPLFGLWRQVRARWRTLQWGLDGTPPRIWST
ncbi:urease accessory protein UreD [Ideonella azotifigens]|uniref:Urease accessory protein UreD n=2 Tax=Ideonella azotifigens TaxID=513160 RepID=A0ABN1KH15_9BURK|nr:urease accessory protein UreD [Ideonella azotifigens]MCD2344916.1 urease accessory protein UreD [Ideonella azotifigens]